MRIWCAQCKRVQHVVERRRQGGLGQSFGGPIGVCAVCGYPVSAIGRALQPAARAMAGRPLVGTLQPAARTIAERPLAAAS